MNCLVKPSYVPSMYDDGCVSYSAWNSGYCLSHLEQDILYNNSASNNPGTNYNYNNLEIVNTIMENAIFDYLSEPGTSPEDLVNPPEGSNLDQILTACKYLPLGCDKFLKQLCQNCTDSDVAGNTGLTTLCGCYVYQTGAVELTNNCNATCNNSFAIKNSVNSVNGNVIPCNQTICVVDEISLAVAQAANGGSPNVTINQVCNGCGSGQCVCIVNFPESGTFNQSIEFTSNSQGVICYRQGMTGQYQIQCPPEVSMPVAGTGVQKILVTLLIFTLMIVFVVILTIIFRFQHKNQNKPKT